MEFTLINLIQFKPIRNILKPPQCVEDFDLNMKYNMLQKSNLLNKNYLKNLLSIMLYPIYKIQ